MPALGNLCGYFDEERENRRLFAGLQLSFWFLPHYGSGKTEVRCQFDVSAREITDGA